MESKFDKTKIQRPINTLFMLMSLDGKINSGNTEELDVDRDWSKIEGVKEGLHRFDNFCKKLCLSFTKYLKE